MNTATIETKDNSEFDVEPTTQQQCTDDTTSDNIEDAEYEFSEEDDDDEDELSSLSDIYGFEDEEDNEEAALDDFLKAQENAD
jgi:hypothetical protein